MNRWHYPQTLSVCPSRKALSVPEVSQLVSKPIVSLGYFILMIVVLVVGIEVLWWWWWATNRCLSLANNTHANKSWLKVSWSFQKFLGLFCGESKRGVCVCGGFLREITFKSHFNSPDKSPQGEIVFHWFVQGISGRVEVVVVCCCTIPRDIEEFFLFFCSAWWKLIDFCWQFGKRKSQWNEFLNV